MNPSSRSDFSCPHDHCFFSDNQQANERRTWIVIGLTIVTMVAEIVSGMVFGSMALLADGWHMASHASAMGLTAAAYFFARKYRNDRRFTFGTGKINDLAGFSSALLLALIAMLMAYESIHRLLDPVAIRFNEAIVVAVLGLVVNLVSAFILNENHHHRHDHDHGAECGHQHHDHNLRAAYLHVLADALTSVLAIVALTIGKIWGWAFLDPVMGIVGALVITRWSVGLLGQTGRVLLDYNNDTGLAGQIRDRLENGADTQVEDLHIWRIGPGHHSAIVALRTSSHQTPEDFKQQLCSIASLSHVTVEINPKANQPSGTGEKDNP